MASSRHLRAAAVLTLVVLITATTSSPAAAFVSLSTPVSSPNRSQSTTINSKQSFHPLQIRKFILELTNGGNNDDGDEEAYNPRDNFGRSLRGFQSSALKGTIEVGDTIVCKLPVPALGIYENASYELQSIYAQKFDDETQTIVKTPLKSLNDPIPPGSALYVTLFSPTYHEKAVVVSPEEVGIYSVRNELGDAAWLAVPGFFWIFVATSFYNVYHERTGGSFADAFWGR